MQQCAVHVEFQLPNEYSRVSYLLDAIETTDASLQAAMALVRNDDNPAVGKRCIGRVGYLLDAIETTDASLQAAMALIRNDDNPAVGKRSNFEATSRGYPL